MEIRHLRRKSVYRIDQKTFDLLCENFCLLDEEKFLEAKTEGYITLTNLCSLARSAGLPFALFFATPDRVRKLINTQNKELFGALDGRYIMGSRGESVDIRWIRRIILDLVGKQKIFSKYQSSERLDDIVGRLKTSKRPIREQADYILDKAGINISEFRRCSTKGAALKYLRSVLSEHHIHTAIEARNYMPQAIPAQIKDSFSGIYIRDPKHPYLFICNELSGSPELGSGRKIYTLIFLLTCLFKDKSYAVSINEDSYSIDKKKFTQFNEIHQIVNEILMPYDEIKVENEAIIYEDLDRLSRKYKVTPKAFLQRLYATRIISDYEKYRKLSDDCSQRFATTVNENKNKQSGGSPGAEVMISYYQGDFLDFVKSYVPATDHTMIIRKHITFNRLNYRITS